jgi:hypothetical protein
MKRIVLVLALAGAFVVPATVEAAPPRAIVGHVTIGPVYPLGYVTRPYVATVLITGAHRSWTVQSDAQGMFRLTVTPGRYVVTGLTTGRIFPRPPTPITVDVGARTIVTVSLVYDSGIR